MRYVEMIKWKSWRIISLVGEEAKFKISLEDVSHIEREVTEWDCEVLDINEKIKTTNKSWLGELITRFCNDST